MFQFPRFPPPHYAVGHLLPGGVAPFGFRRIIGCQHLPNAFRRVATSFIGPRRLGIHHVLFFDDVIVIFGFWLFFVVRAVKSVTSSTLANPADSLSFSRCPSQSTRTTRPHRGGAAGIRTPDLRRARAALSRLSYGPKALSKASPHLWARLDSNQGPRPYQGRALTT